MKNIIIIAFAMMLFSCNSNTSVKDNATATSGLLYNPEHGAPGHDCALPVGAPLKQNTQNLAPQNLNITDTNAEQQPVVEAPVETKTIAVPQATNAKINPPHGQPGHDCAIAVGAPLTAKAKSQADMPVKQASTAFNPPHGEPGHVCGNPVTQSNQELGTTHLDTGKVSPKR